MVGIEHGRGVSDYGAAQDFQARRRDDADGRSGEGTAFLSPVKVFVSAADADDVARTVSKATPVAAATSRRIERVTWICIAYDLLRNLDWAVSRPNSIRCPQT
jgi:hypothetical protein